MGSSQNPLAVSAPVRLLFIGNKEDDFHRLRTLLSQPNGASFHLDHALSTRESLARLEQAAYDLVLFDYRSGDPVAMQTVHELRKHHSSR